MISTRYNAVPEKTRGHFLCLASAAEGRKEGGEPGRKKDFGHIKKIPQPENRLRNLFYVPASDAEEFFLSTSEALSFVSPDRR
ncbi:hypothetical protein [Bilophila wadsworthia]|uniref:hypothetical protein n=1 Tax=Bilophila wadsworthia TaxID=35833 RepID=UPI002432DE20|nr:hypothetical protein [Bilophila wadsworthia]